MKKYETCPKGLNYREWRKFLDLVEHHKSMGAGAGLRRHDCLPGRVTPPPKQNRGG